MANHEEIHDKNDRKTQKRKLHESTINRRDETKRKNKYLHSLH